MSRKETLKIATYNVNSVRSRLHILIPWLEVHRPDLLCMQETKVADSAFPVAVFENAGYHVEFRGEKRYNGVAIVSRRPPKEISCGFDDGGPPDADRLIRGVYGGITVLNLYVPQGRSRDHEQFQYKIQWFDRLRTYLEDHARPQDLLVCCGDLNVAREDIDVHDPKRLRGHVDFTPEVWDAFDRFMEWGLVDLFRKHHGDEPGQYTFFDYRAPRALERGLGWRVDHILATPLLSDASIRCSIDLDPRTKEKPSDHTILMAEFAL